MVKNSNLLKEDKEFFTEYKENFINKFREKLFELGFIKEIEGNLNFILQTIYESVLKGNINNALVRNYILKFMKKNIPIRDILISIFADLLVDYINYLKSKPTLSFEIKKIKDLVNLLDKYISQLDTLFADYLNNLSFKSKFQGMSLSPKATEDILKHLKESNISQINLLYLYKHFPILCKSSIISISDMFIKVKKCPYKVFAPCEQVYLKVPKVNKWSVAEITNVQNDFMYLKPLKYVESFEPPKQVRVFPKKEITVKLEASKGNVFGYIDFISFEELGVVTSSVDKLKEGQKVKVHFTLPTGEVYIPAIVKRIKPLEEVWLVQLDLEPDLKAEQCISRYVLKRQQEILRELKI
jgi:hypothetical protein